MVLLVCYTEGIVFVLLTDITPIQDAPDQIKMATMAAP